MTSSKCRAKVGTDFALNTGTNIPSVGFGTWKIPKEKAKETVKQAIECGYRHIDCALEYGNQEEIGEAIHGMIEAKQITRGELFITSKLWNTHHKRHGAYNDIDTTLRQLKQHHLDLWLMHWPLAFIPASNRAGDGNTQAAKDQNGKVMLDDTTTILETWKAMEEMHKDGKARAIGVSNFTLPQLEQLLSVCEIPPAVVQIELHPYLQQVELIEFCQSKGIHVTAYSPLGSQAAESVDVLQDPVLQEIAKVHKKTPGQVVLQWNLQRHISVIPKASSPEHMQENLQVFDFDLTSDETRKIEGLDRGMRFLSAKKIWGIPLFPDETGEVPIEQAVGDMFASVETQQSK
jgi:aldehyde reductase